KTRNDSWADRRAYRSCALCAFARLRRRFVGNRGADVAGSKGGRGEENADTVRSRRDAFDTRQVTVTCPDCPLAGWTRRSGVLGLVEACPRRLAHRRLRPPG